MQHIGTPGLRIAALLTLATSSAGVCAEPQAIVSRSETRIAVAAGEIRRFVDELGAVEGGFPAMAVVVATPISIPLLHIAGSRKASEPQPVSRNSEFYIASQTKAFVGLLGARLDEQGVLPLDTTLSQVWPGLKLPPPIDPRKITLRDLLTHQVPLTTDSLNNVTAYVRAIPAQEFAADLEAETKPRDPGFRYSNLGYLIYGAALETRTGRPWQWWLRRTILEPLNLRHTVTRLNASPSRHVWTHLWTERGWVAIAPKPPALMHAAGGMVATAPDLARWIQANLIAQDEKGRTWSAFPAAQRQATTARLNDGDFKCGGYSLGWYVCDFKGQRILLSTGEYVGTQSFTALLPDASVGLSFVATSDSGIQRVGLEMIKAFAGMIAGDPAAASGLVRARADYPKSISAVAERRSKDLKAALSDAQWGKWDWAPPAAETARMIGKFENPLFGTLTIGRSKDGMAARVGVTTLRLQPASRNRFATWSATSLAPEPLDYDPATDTVRFRARPFVRAARKID